MPDDCPHVRQQVGKPFAATRPQPFAQCGRAVLLLRLRSRRGSGLGSAGGGRLGGGQSTHQPQLAARPPSMRRGVAQPGPMSRSQPRHRRRLRGSVGGSVGGGASSSASVLSLLSRSSAIVAPGRAVRVTAVAHAPERGQRTRWYEAAKPAAAYLSISAWCAERCSSAVLAATPAESAMLRPSRGLLCCAIMVKAT